MLTSIKTMNSFMCKILVALLVGCAVFICISMSLIYFKTKTSFSEHDNYLNNAIPYKASNENKLMIPVLPKEHFDGSISKVSTYSTVPHKLQEIVLAVVACGDRLAETLVMLKSAILFTKSPLKFIVVADDQLIPSFKEKLHEWNRVVNNSFSYEVYPITFPLQGNTGEWRRLFKPCASQRLFLPTVLHHIDSLLYVDTDTLFLGPLEDVWNHFYRMNGSQIAALTPEHEDPNTGWYNRFARHPYYGKLGVNSGVMLMNLTRMRAFHWTDYVVPIYKEYKLKITWGDQDIINIIFHFHPDKLYIYPCRFNYRPDHCMYMSVCRSADKFGVAVLHGSRGSFHAEKQPPFRAVYSAMEEYQLGTDPYINLFLPMKNYLEVTSSSNCGKVKHIFTKSLQNYFQKTGLREER